MASIRQQEMVRSFQDGQKGEKVNICIISCSCLYEEKNILIHQLFVLYIFDKHSQHENIGSVKWQAMAGSFQAITQGYEEEQILLKIWTEIEEN